VLILWAWLMHFCCLKPAAALCPNLPRLPFPPWKWWVYHVEVEFHRRPTSLHLTHLTLLNSTLEFMHHTRYAQHTCHTPNVPAMCTTCLPPAQHIAACACPWITHATCHVCRVFVWYVCRQHRPSVLGPSCAITITRTYVSVHDGCGMSSSRAHSVAAIHA
jgi:hypothetical protein